MQARRFFFFIKWFIIDDEDDTTGEDLIEDTENIEDILVRAGLEADIEHPPILIVYLHLAVKIFL